MTVFNMSVGCANTRLFADMLAITTFMVAGLLLLLILALPCCLYVLKYFL